MLLYEKLKIIDKKYSEISDEITKNKMICSKVINVEKVKDITQKIVSLNERKEAVEKLNDSLNNVRNSISEGERYIAKLKSEMGINLEGYRQLLKKISKCPVCFSDIDQKTIERVLKQYEEVLN
jgi:exonuclease SbcC